MPKAWTGEGAEAGYCYWEITPNSGGQLESQSRALFIGFSREVGVVRYRMKGVKSFARIMRRI